MEDSHLWNKLAKYFSGEATEEEIRSVEEWIDQSKENQKVASFFKRIWSLDARSTYFNSIDLDKLWKETHQEIADRPRIHKKEGNRLKTNDFLKYAVAAVLLLGVLISGILLFNFGTEAESQLKTFNTEIGESKEVELSDGSVIMLGPDTELSFSEHFNVKNRQVNLSGEAYLKIQSDLEFPFQIHTNSTVVEVLGTEFNVKSYQGQESDEIFVVEGMVQVWAQTSKENSAILSDNDIAIYSKVSDEFKVDKVNNPLLKLGWMNNVLIYDDTELIQVIRDLEKWFPVDISIEDSRKKRQRITAEFSSRQDIEEIISAISLVLSIDYEVNGSTIKLK